MSKRLEMLEKMAAGGAADSFALYALAMEYRKESRVDEALDTFAKLRAGDADYLPMYLMAAQLLIEMERPAEARAWIEPGIALATRQGDGKARGELESALAECDD